MKTTLASLALLMVFAGNTPGQEPPPPPPFPGSETGPSVSMTQSPEGGFRVMVRARGGDWWKDPELVQKLALNNDQVQKIEKLAQDRQMQQIDLRADVEKQNLLLGSMMDDDSPDEAQVFAQVQQAFRGTREAGEIARGNADLHPSRSDC